MGAFSPLVVPPPSENTVGATIAVDDEWLALGEAGADCLPTGYRCGIVHLYRRQGTQWVPAPALKAPEPVPYAGFGARLALHDGLLLVGAPFELLPHCGMCGAVYVFRREASAWVFEQKLTVPEELDDVSYALAGVAIHENLAVIGTTNGKCDGDSCNLSTDVFRRDPLDGAWEFEARLSVEVNDAQGYYGRNVAAFGDVVVVGNAASTVKHPMSDCCSAHAGQGCSLPGCQATICFDRPECCSKSWGDECSAAAMNFFSCDCQMGREGAAYVFRRSNGAWNLDATLTAPEPHWYQEFGSAVGIHENVIAIGEHFSGIGYFIAGGAVHVFRDESGAWRHEARLTPEEQPRPGSFGAAVAVSSLGIVVGAQYTECADGYSFVCGSADWFQYSDNTWHRHGLSHSYPMEGYQFGADVAAGGTVIAVGAPGVPCPEGRGGSCGRAFLFSADTVDCDCDGLGDECALALGSVLDCNGNRRPDRCDIADGTSQDCNADGVPNECDTDCQPNGIPDGCDIQTGTSMDCNRNVYPDECELTGPDCNRNGIADATELTQPAIMLHEGFENGEVDPATWSLAVDVEILPEATSPEDNFLARIGDGGILESRPFDLSGAYLATLRYEYRLTTQTSSALDIEWWDGVNWNLLRHETETAIQSPAGLNGRVLNLPARAFHSSLRLRFRPHQFAVRIDDIKLTRLEGDCDQSGVLDACEVSACGVPDCNHNGQPDSCDFRLFRPGVTTTTHFNLGANSVSSADVDQDGDFDLIIGRGRFFQPATLTTLLNDGSGTFEGRPRETAGGSWLRSLAAADFNNDGAVDVAAASTHGNAVALFPNKGGSWSGFGLPIYFSDETMPPHAVAATDVDRDGDMDLLTTHGELEGGSLGYLRTLLNYNAIYISFAKGPTIPLGQQPRDVVVFDADRDDWPDLAVVNQFSPYLTVALNRGRNGAGVWQGFTSPSFVGVWGDRQPFGIASADWDRDSLPDLAVAYALSEAGDDGPSTVSVYLNAGIVGAKDVLFYPPTEWPVGRVPFALEAVDFDLDGWPDLVVANREENTLSILLNLGIASSGEWAGFRSGPTLPVGSLPVGVALADLNGDGAPDIAIANRAFNSVGQNVGIPSASVILQVPPATSDCNQNAIPDDCDAAKEDCDHDGRPDECAMDCDFDGEPDGCQYAEGGLPDCNHNGVHDFCDPGYNCDFNELLDACESSSNFSAASDLIFLWEEDVAYSWVVPFAPTAGGGVRILGYGSSPVEVSLNGHTIGTLNLQGGSRCPLATGFAELNLPAAEFNEYLQGGKAEFSLIAPQLRFCWTPVPSSTPFVRIMVEYFTLHPTDCNRNGVPDDCDLESGEAVDFDGNQVPDECDADCQSNGTPDLFELDANDCNQNAVPDDCELAKSGNDCNHDQRPDDCGVLDACTASPISAFDAPDRARFGAAVALSDRFAFAGAMNESCDPIGSQCGAVYVFDRSTMPWTQLPKLTPLVRAGAATFGSALAVDGQTLVVGAPRDSNQGCDHCGSAYVFRFNGTQWIEEAKLNASDGNSEDQFGISVGLSGDCIAIGAPLVDREFLPNSGAVYLFCRQAGTWVERAKLASGDINEGDAFGRQVALDGGLLVVGAPLQDPPGDEDSSGQFRRTCVDCGAAYVFRHRGGAWVEEGKFLAPLSGANSVQFGSAVALHDDRILIGPTRGCGSGSVFCGIMYSHSSNGWREEDRLFPSEPDRARNPSGFAVALHSDTALVSAFNELSCSIGSPCGSVALYQRGFDGWQRKAVFPGNTTGQVDAFGSSVAIMNDLALIGLPKGSTENCTNCGSMLPVIVEGQDCDCNAANDACEAMRDTGLDFNANLQLDRCEVDADGDRDIDLADIAAFQRCFGDALNSKAPKCAGRDFDGDGLVALPDFAPMTTYLSGPIR